MKADELRLARQLGQLTPRAVRLDRDHLMFLAGQRSQARPRALGRSRQILVIAATAFLAFHFGQTNSRTVFSPPIQSSIIVPDHISRQANESNYLKLRNLSIETGDFLGAQTSVTVKLPADDAGILRAWPGLGRN